MKKIIASILLATTLITHSAPPFQEMSYEMRQYTTNLYWTEFLGRFYDSFKGIFYEIRQNVASIPYTLYQVLLGHNHSTDVAHVRYSEQDDIGQEERMFIEKRLPYVKEGLEKFLKVPLLEHKVPRIGMVFSGGGFRAMLTTLGFLCGAEKIGLLDATFYCSGLSGSTWALAPWIASGKTLQEYTTTLTKKITNGIDHINDPYELGELLQVFVTKLLYKQFVSAMDIYGGLIANTLLKTEVKNPLTLKLTDAHKQVIQGKIPMPIYSAIQENKGPYEWMEFTPFEIGSSFLKSYIPTWAYGRKFKGGISKDTSPEQTLGYFMGTFGSAFAVNLKDVIHYSATELSSLSNRFPDILAKTLKKCLTLIVHSFVGEIRLFPSMLANFTYLYGSGPFQQEKTITLIDAGIDFNLAFPPLLRAARQVDIMIVYDASAEISNAPELKRAALYAQRNGIKFPPINFQDASTQPISIFKDPTDSNVPVIIYFPRLKNEQFSTTFDPERCIQEEYCHSFNFVYKPEEAQQLCDFAEFILKEKKKAVKQAIKDVLHQKFGYTNLEKTSAHQAYA